MRRAPYVSDMRDADSGGHLFSLSIWLMRIRFSLRTLLIFTGLVGIFLGWLVSTLIRVQEQRAIVARLKALGASVYYDYQVQGGRIDPSREPYGAWPLRWLLGDDAFSRVAVVTDVTATSPLSEADLALFGRLPELNDVGLRGPGITDATIRWLAETKGLRALSLSDTQVTGDGLSALQACPDFTSLVLYGAGVTDDLLTLIDKLAALESLQLARTNVTSAGLAHLSRSKRLQRLDVFEGKLIGDEGLAHLAGLTKLRTLQLLETKVGDEGLGHLAGLVELRMLNLGNTAVTDEGVASLTHLSNLETLDLRWTKVSDAAMDKLAGLPRLKRLTLSGCQITDGAADQLAAMHKLESLFLEDTALSDVGLAKLRSLTKLRLLEVGPNVSEKAAAELKRAVPNCWIRGWDANGGSKFEL